MGFLNNDLYHMINIYPFLHFFMVQHIIPIALLDSIPNDEYVQNK
jgi:hypothetical protein